MACDRCRRRINGVRVNAGRPAGYKRDDSSGDGLRLSANLILPRAKLGEKLPVILIRTPYTPSDEVGEPLAAQLLPRLVRDGYALAIVNDRGTQWSEGRYRWLLGQNRDGYDILDWITKQAWSNGKVGTF